MTIGSVKWRVLNYGFKATFKYLLFDKSPLRISKRNLSANVKLNNLEISIIDEDLLAFKDNFLLKTTNQIKLNKSKNAIKMSGNIADESVNRFLAIAYVIKKYTPDIFLESGTQHGLTALFAQELAKFLNLSTKVFSYDVTDELWKLDGDYTKIILSRPTRKSFLKHLKIIKNQYQSKKIVFFHDSDHSYENMKFELTQVSKILDPIVIISDDISGNNSFRETFSNNLYKAYKVSFDNGPTVGIAINLISDPDGT